MRLSIVVFDRFTALDTVGGYEVLADVSGITTESIAARTGPVFADTRRLHATSTWTVGICNCVELLGPAGLYLAGLIAGEDVAKTIQLGIEYYPDPPFGNGTPDTAPTAAQALVRAFEAGNLERLEALQPAI